MLSLLSVRFAGRRGPVAVLVMLAVVALALVFGAAAGAGASPNNDPRSGVTSPTRGSVLPLGVPVMVTGVAVNGETGGIVSVDVSVDGGATWDRAEGTETWLFTFTPTEPGPLTITSRAATEDVFESPAYSYPVTVGEGTPPPVHCPCTLVPPFLPNRPVITDPDAVPVELGLRFKPDRDGLVTGVYFFRHPGNTGPHVAHLWSSDGELLAEATAANATGIAPRLTFSQPVPVRAGSTYVASYYTPSGHYASTEDFFSGVMVLPPFSTVFDENGGAGVYRYGTGGGFPDQTWHASNYWVGPIFSTS